jgi:DNA mismatch repair ATPase MutL
VQPSLTRHFSSSFEIVEEPQNDKQQEINSSSPILALRSLSNEISNTPNLLSSSSEVATDYQAKDISHILQEEELIDNNSSRVQEIVNGIDVANTSTSFKKPNHIVENKDQTTLDTFLDTEPVLERHEETKYHNLPESDLPPHGVNSDNSNPIETKTVNIYGDIALSSSQSLSESVNQPVNKNEQEPTDNNVATGNTIKRKRSTSTIDTLLAASNKHRSHLHNLTMTEMFSTEACRLYHEQLKNACSDGNSKHIDNPITSLVRQHQTLQNEAGLTSDATTAEQALSRVVKKEAFYRMEILGQFNHGFILVLLPDSTQPKEDIKLLSRRKHGDLFIIDQHAADEKWWYEKLISQPQDRPQPLLR